MTEDLKRALQGQRGPLSPAVQLRLLLAFGRDHGWRFESAWKWSFERLRFPHDTTQRREWKAIIGERHDDPRLGPVREREMWRRAYERLEATRCESATGRLLAAA